MSFNCLSKLLVRQSAVWLPERVLHHHSRCWVLCSRQEKDCDLFWITSCSLCKRDCICMHTVASDADWKSCVDCLFSCLEGLWTASVCNCCISGCDFCISLNDEAFNCPTSPDCSTPDMISSSDSSSEDVRRRSPSSDRAADDGGDLSFRNSSEKLLMHW